jgi:hypothetical protein
MLALFCLLLLGGAAHATSPTDDSLSSIEPLPTDGLLPRHLSTYDSWLGQTHSYHANLFNSTRPGCLKYAILDASCSSIGVDWIPHTATPGSVPPGMQLCSWCDDSARQNFNSVMMWQKFHPSRGSMGCSDKWVSVSPTSDLYYVTGKNTFELSHENTDLPPFLCVLKGRDTTCEYTMKKKCDEGEAMVVENYSGNITCEKCDRTRQYNSVGCAMVPKTKEHCPLFALETTNSEKCELCLSAFDHSDHTIVPSRHLLSGRRLKGYYGEQYGNRPLLVGSNEQYGTPRLFGGYYSSTPLSPSRAMPSSPGGYYSSA